MLSALDASSAGGPLQGGDSTVIQCKGLVLLGVMVEGEEPLQEAVRQRMVEERAVSR